jgi:cation diffusion facilitator family transporter
MTTAANPSTEERRAMVRRGQVLSRVSLGYNSLEAIVSLVVGVMAGSISLVGFGADSVIEVSSSVAALWRLRADANPVRRARVETVTLRLIGLLFLGLTVYIVIDAVHALYMREAPEKTVAGIVIAAASVVIMPLLARAKRRIGLQLGSRALTADAMQTSLCTWLSAIVLLGVGLNAVLGWWWADPVAALFMTPIIAKEGIEGLRGEDHCADGC